LEVNVLFFAIARERVGNDSETVCLESGAKVSHLWETLCLRHRSLEALRANLRVAVNQSFVDDDFELSAGDEIAVIPPVSGGSGRSIVTEQPLNALRVEALVASPRAGAVVTFTGRVRNHTKGREVSHLEYEVYPEMAVAKLDEICAEVTARWPDAMVAIEHRYGKLEIGEASVVIAVSSPHRAEAFEGCRHVIERIKECVPIWKKEVGPAGEEWVGMGS
jgi:molybdopterin synthase catalytic subunit